MPVKLALGVFCSSSSAVAPIYVATAREMGALIAQRGHTLLFGGSDVGLMRVLARSAPLTESVIATPVEPHPYRQELLDAILALHQSPRGKQLLTVFKTGRLVRISPGDIEAARALWVEYMRAGGALPGSTPHPPAFPTAVTAVTAPNRPPTQEKD